VHGDDPRHEIDDPVLGHAGRRVLGRLLGVAQLGCLGHLDDELGGRREPGSRYRSDEHDIGRQEADASTHDELVLHVDVVGVARHASEVPRQPGDRAAMLRSDGVHLDQDPVDELDSLGLGQDARMDHRDDVVDAETAGPDGGRSHRASVPRALDEVGASPQRRAHPSDGRCEDPSMGLFSRDKRDPPAQRQSSAEENDLERLGDDELEVAISELEQMVAESMSDAPIPRETLELLQIGLPHLIQRECSDEAVVAGQTAARLGYLSRAGEFSMFDGELEPEADLLQTLSEALEQADQRAPRPLGGGRRSVVDAAGAHRPGQGQAARQPGGAHPEPVGHPRRRPQADLEVRLLPADARRALRRLTDRSPAREARCLRARDRAGRHRFSSRALASMSTPTRKTTADR